MVTSTEAEDQLSNLLVKGSDKWNLLDHTKRDAWLLRTRSALQSNDMLTALEQGPPTPEWVLSKNPGISDAAARNISDSLMDDYHEANSAGYGVLLKRIDIEKRKYECTRRGVCNPRLAAKARRRRFASAARE